MNEANNTLDRVGSIFLRALLRRMKEMGLNKTTLAKRMNVSRAYVCKVFSGDVNISFGTALRFAHALQMDFVPMLTPSRASGERVSATPAFVSQGALAIGGNA